MPVFSGHTGVTNVELLIYFFFLWGEGTISVIYWETQFILFVRVGIFLGGGGGGGYRGCKIQVAPPTNQNFLDDRSRPKPFHCFGSAHFKLNCLHFIRLLPVCLAKYLSSFCCDILEISKLSRVQKLFHFIDRK